MSYPKVVALDTDWTIWPGLLDHRTWERNPDNIERVDRMLLQNRTNRNNQIRVYNDISRIVNDILKNGAKLAMVSANPSKDMCDRALYYFNTTNPRNNNQEWSIINPSIMPIVCEFDTVTVHSDANPEPDTEITLDFPCPFSARPRIAHGFCELDIDKNATMSVESTINYFTDTWADCHITGLEDTTLYSAIDDAFVLAPEDEEFLIGAYMRNLMIDPDAPASLRVDFERPFTAPPKVVVFFDAIDVDKNHNWRLKTSATDVDVDGFTINIETWADTILYAAQAVWIAYPADRKQIYSTSVNTMDVRPLNAPQLKQSKTITFGNVEFSKVPTIFVALNSFDIDCKANFRLKAYVDGVSKTGLVWHIDSWHDTVLYSAGASIIAFT